MHYALTINKDQIITGVHESLLPIERNAFASNQHLSSDSLVSIAGPAEYRTGDHILCFNEDGTRRPDLWCIQNGYMELPPNKEIINGELIDKQMPAEDQPQTLKEYLEQQFTYVRQESDERMISLKPLVTQLIKDQPADLVIGTSEFILPWREGRYVVGDVRMWEGQPKRCCQAHDSTMNSTWTPSVASLWSPFHATNKENALPWIQPTGAHDMYKANEYMVFTDGRTYCCLQDTAYSPAEYPQAWKAINDNPEEGITT